MAAQLLPKDLVHPSSGQKQLAQRMKKLGEKKHFLKKIFGKHACI